MFDTARNDSATEARRSILLYLDTQSMDSMLRQRRSRRLITFFALGLSAWLAIRLFDHRTVSAASAGPSFVEFESGPVRPVAMSPDGKMLFVTNIPNGTLEIFDLSSGRPMFKYRVP